jgi:hypothetical protein
MELRQHLQDNKDEPDCKLILGESDSPSKMVTSNLRRAISTGLVGMTDRSVPTTLYLIMPLLQ